MQESSAQTLEAEEAKGWHACLKLNFEQRSGKTVLAQRQQSGPLTVQRPFYPEDEVCHLYLLHPPGGVVGGDELHINVDVQKNAHALITTPGATKFYLNAGKLAKQIQTLTVKDAAALEWFPQENIFFNDSSSQLGTRIELEAEARFIGWEINCYGRPVSAEDFTHGEITTRFELIRDGIHLLKDTLNVSSALEIQSPACLNGHTCFGTLVSTQANKELLDQARQAIQSMQNPTAIGITLLDDILVARCLGQYSEQVMNTLKQVWTVLRPSVLKRAACHPRIWST